MSKSTYVVELRSVPGPYEQYHGTVEVFVEDETTAGEAAIRRVRLTTFPDRGPSMWQVVNITRRKASK